MEATTITFLKSRQETEKALLAFSTSSKIGSLFQRFLFPVLTIIFFLITLKQNLPSHGDFAINGQPYPIIAFLFWLYIPVLFGLFFGWVFSAVLKTARKNGIIQEVKNIPPEHFGEITVTFDSSELGYYAPLLKVKYDWRLLDSILVTSEFLFICSGQGFTQRLIIWLPIKAFDDQTSVIISNIEKWLSESKGKTSMKPKTA